MKTLFSLPILMIFPQKPTTLTAPLHFDELFRVHLVGKKIGDTVIYKDFFTSSFSFLDQQGDEAYAQKCVEILEILLKGNKISTHDENISIQQGEHLLTTIPSANGKIIQFSE